jgi:hypothetical protein
MAVTHSDVRRKTHREPHLRAMTAPPCGRRYTEMHRVHPPLLAQQRHSRLSACLQHCPVRQGRCDEGLDRLTSDQGDRRACSPVAGQHRAPDTDAAELATTCDWLSLTFVSSVRPRIQLIHDCPRLSRRLDHFRPRPRPYNVGRDAWTPVPQTRAARFQGVQSPAATLR